MAKLINHYRHMMERNNLKKVLAAIKIILLFFFLSCCSQRFGIIRKTRIVERPDVEVLKNGSALIRSAYCDVYIKDYDDIALSKILKNSSFTRKYRKKSLKKTQGINFFMIIIKNTIDRPILLEDIYMSYGNIRKQTLTTEKLSSALKSSTYSFINGKALTAYRRLPEPGISIFDIDYDKETIESKFNFIPPNDTIATFIAFDFVPVQIREFKITFTFNASGNKKIIDFDFTKREYRTKGSFFIE